MNIIFALLVLFLRTSIISITIKENELLIKELQKFKTSTPKDNLLSYLEKDIQLFLPKSRPESSLNTTKSILNQKESYIIPDSLLDDYENALTQDKIEKIILKEQNILLSKYQKGYEVYADITKLKYDTYYIWNKLIKKNVEVKDFPFSPVKQLIETTPQYVSVLIPICMPNIILFHITNPSKENLIIRSIRTDMYQIKIFPYYPHNINKENILQISSILPRSILPKETLTMQLIILADNRRITNGSLYIEFNDKKILIIPIMIKGEENPYRISPIYFPDLSSEKFLSVPIKIYNPHSKVLVIKEVTHSFTNINLLWPNGVPVTSNSTAVSTSMLEIQPRSNKNIMYVKYFKETEGREYGVLHLKTDKDVIIIPILINTSAKALTTYPRYLNFGICGVRNKISKVIPVSITNIGKNDMLIKGVYLNYDDDFVEFVYNRNNKTAVVSPSDEILYGYAIFNADNINEDSESFNNKLHKITRGAIYIETNATKSSIIEMKYSYFLDNGRYSGIVSGNEQFIEKSKMSSMSFDIVARFKFPIGIEQSYSYYSNENEKQILISDEKDRHIRASIRSPNNIHKYANQNEKNVNIHVNISSIQTLSNSKYYFFPLKLTHRLHTLIPLKLYDNTLDLLLCNGNENSSSYLKCLSESDSDYFKNINANSKDLISFNIDMGMLSLEQTKRMILYIINDNNHIISIENIYTDTNEVVFDIEDSVTLNENDHVKILDDVYSKGELSRRMLSNETSRIRIPIYSNSALKLSLNVRSINEGALRGEIGVVFANGKMNTFIIEAKVFKGNLNLTPSAIRFDPSFPGLNQYKSITSKSSYRHTIDIIGISSTDSRVIPRVVHNEIPPNNRTEIIKLVFDPSKEENFIAAPVVINIGSYLTYRDLYLWRESEKKWNLLLKEGRSEINSQIRLKTSITTEMINVKAILTKPSLVIKNEINFGLVQIGETIKTYIDGFNPSDFTLRYQVLLSSEDYSDNMNDMFNNKRNRKQSDSVYVFDCAFMNDTKRTISENGSRIILDDDEEIKEIESGKASKKEILKKIFLYGDEKIKRNFLYSEKIICDYRKRTKTKIVLSNDERLINEIFFDNFNKEIPIIKKMTEKQADFMNNDDDYSNSGIFTKILSKLITIIKNFFQNDQIKSTNLNDDATSDEYSNQDFYIPKSVSSQVFTVKPHQKFRIGPVIYHPKKFSFSSVTLFIKNNLTVLYPIKLSGDGGSGIARFLNTRSISNKGMKLIDNSKLIIEIDKEIFLSEMTQSNNITRTITLSNVGNLSLKINNISIENTGCEGYGIKILQCDLFTLGPDENVDIDLVISPDFNFYMFEKEIFFFCDYQTISLKVVVNINKDILSMKNKLFNFDYMKSYQFLSVLIAVMIWLAVMSIAKSDLSREKKMIRSESIGDLSMLRFENLFMKAYRRNNRSFYEDFENKQIEKQRSVIEDEAPQMSQTERRGGKRKRKSSAVKSNSENESKKEEIKNEIVNEQININKESSNVIRKKTKNKKGNRKPVGMKEIIDEDKRPSIANRISDTYKKRQNIKNENAPMYSSDNNSSYHPNANRNVIVRQNQNLQIDKDKSIFISDDRTDTSSKQLQPSSQKTPLSIHNQFTSQFKPRSESLQQKPPEPVNESMDDASRDYNDYSNYDFSRIFIKKDESDNDSDDDEKCHSDENQNVVSISDSNQFDDKLQLDQMIGESNMKATVTFSGNELTDEELMSTENKPYFKSLINDTFNDTKAFYNNPFSHSKSKGFLDELINDEENVAPLNTIDEVEEDVQDENEEDPEWITEEIDMKKEGYFDEKGRYKIKQIGFNFN